MPATTVLIAATATTTTTTTTTVTATEDEDAGKKAKANASAGEIEADETKVTTAISAATATATEDTATATTLAATVTITEQNASSTHADTSAIATADTAATATTTLGMKIRHGVFVCDSEEMLYGVNGILFASGESEPESPALADKIGNTKDGYAIRTSKNCVAYFVDNTQELTSEKHEVKRRDDGEGAMIIEVGECKIWLSRRGRPFVTEITVYGSASNRNYTTLSTELGRHQSDYEANRHVGSEYMLSLPDACVGKDAFITTISNAGKWTLGTIFKTKGKHSIKEYRSKMSEEDKARRVTESSLYHKVLWFRIKLSKNGKHWANDVHYVDYH